LKQSFFRYEDWNDLRLGEFKQKIEKFSPLEFFTKFQNLHTCDRDKVEIMTEILNLPKLVTGERKRFDYLVTKLIENSVKRNE
jgi:hypothetical protein